jgi:polygalacturonase
MSSVDNPIIIDQRYCPSGSGCPGGSSGIRISDLRYVGIWGSSATPVAVNFDCGRSNPCVGIRLQDAGLTYRSHPAAAKSYRRNVQGSTLGFVLPPSCL